jgi:hypothetical protein
MRKNRCDSGAVIAIACALFASCAEPTTPSIEGAASSDQDKHDCKSDCNAKQVSLLSLRDDMRALWTDHVALTRFYIIESIAELPGADATAARLLRNQDDIGNAIKPFYGSAAGDELSRLLREHILGAVAVLDAAKAGNVDALASAQAAWFANADEIASFLATANPNLPVGLLRDAMHEHLEQTTAEATARLTGDFDGDVRTFDMIVEHILGLADTLANGIAAQFPDRVRLEPEPGEETHLAMRKLWEDHVIWTRNVIISVIANGDCVETLPDLEAALGRLLRNQDDIGGAARPFIGDEGAGQLTTLLREHITVAGEILFAAKTNDADALADAVARWYVNADEISHVLAGALGLPEQEVAAMMRTHLDQTLVEARSYLTGKFDQSLTAYDQIVKHILEMSDAISGAL